MRNLKRALSLTLASVMLLGMMVVGSSAAAGYDDVADTDNVEAIEVLQAVEVMVGDERGFGPERPVNRAEMAVVMGKLLNLDYNYYEATCPFNDVYDWARGWVGACYANGIVSGRGEGVYDPGTTVTAVEAASMLMRALGYFKYQSDYASGFEVSTVLQANKIRLFDGVNSKTNEPLTRNQVAQMALNALKSGMVEPDGNALNFIDASGNVIATGGKVNYVFVTSNKTFATAISSVKASSMGSSNDSPIVELGEQLYDGKLKLTDTTDDFERPSRYWEYDAKAIGTYVKEELIRQEYTVKVTGRTLHDLLGSTTIKDYDLVVAIDGVDDSDVNTHVFNKSAMVRTNENGVGATGKGVLTQVFVDPDEGANGLITIAIINTYLAIAEEDFDDRTDDVDFRVYGIEPIPNYRNEYWKTANISNSKPTDESSIFKLETEDFPEIVDVKENDATLVTVAKGEVQTMAAPEILSGVQISSFKQADWIVSGGTQYDFASAAEFEMDTLYDYTATDNAVVNLKDINYNIYLDKYGYAVGVEEVDRVDNYMFITGVDTNTVNRYAVQADASAIFLDGTMEAVKIDMKAARDLVDQSTYQALVGADAEISTDDQALNNYKGGSLINKWFTYTVGNDGVYEVVLVGDDAAVDKGARAGQFRTLTEKDASIPDGTGFAALGTASHGVDKIGPKSIALRGADTPNSTWYSVYGDDQSVYITAELETIQDANGSDKYHVNIISGVDNVAVGIDEADIEVWDKNTALAKGTTSMNPVATAYGSYVLFDDDGDIIGAVVVGEDAGTVTNLVYTHKSKIESETDNNAGSSRANSTKGDYTWTRKVVSNGEEVTLTEVGSGLSKLKSMLPNTWYVVKYNAKGEVKNVYPAWDTAKYAYGYKGLIDAQPTDPALEEKTRTEDQYVNNIEELNTATNENSMVLFEVGQYNTGKTTPVSSIVRNDYDAKAVGDVNWLGGDSTPTDVRMSGKPYVDNHTLYITTQTNTGVHRGFRVADDVKTVFIQTNNREETTVFESGYSRLEKVIDRLHDHAEYGNWAGVYAYHYEISAVMNNGKATVVVIRDLNNAGATFDTSRSRELRLYGNLFTALDGTVTGASNAVVVADGKEITPVRTGADSWGNYSVYSVPQGVTVGITDYDIDDIEAADGFRYMTNMPYNWLRVRELSRSMSFEMPAYDAWIIGSRRAFNNESIRGLVSASVAGMSVDVTFDGNKPGDFFRVNYNDTVRVVIDGLKADTDYSVVLGATPNGAAITRTSNADGVLTINYTLNGQDIFNEYVRLESITLANGTPVTPDDPNPPVETEVEITYDEDERFDKAGAKEHSFVVNVKDPKTPITKVSARMELALDPSAALSLVGDVTPKGDNYVVNDNPKTVKVVMNEGWKYLSGNLWSGKIDGTGVIVQNGISASLASLSRFSILRTVEEIEDPSDLTWLVDAMSDFDHTYTITVGDTVWIGKAFKMGVTEAVAFSLALEDGSDISDEAWDAFMDALTNGDVDSVTKDDGNDDPNPPQPSESFVKAEFTQKGTAWTAALTEYDADGKKVDDLTKDELVDALNAGSKEAKAGLTFNEDSITFKGKNKIVVKSIEGTEVTVSGAVAGEKNAKATQVYRVTYPGGEIYTVNSGDTAKGLDAAVYALLPEDELTGNATGTGATAIAVTGATATKAGTATVTPIKNPDFKADNDIAEYMDTDYVAAFSIARDANIGDGVLTTGINAGKLVDDNSTHLLTLEVKTNKEDSIDEKLGDYKYIQADATIIVSAGAGVDSNMAGMGVTLKVCEETALTFTVGADGTFDPEEFALADVMPAAEGQAVFKARVTAAEVPVYLTYADGSSDELVKYEDKTNGDYYVAKDVPAGKNIIAKDDEYDVYDLVASNNSTRVNDVKIPVADLLDDNGKTLGLSEDGTQIDLYTAYTVASEQTSNGVMWILYTDLKDCGDDKDEAVWTITKAKPTGIQTVAYFPDSMETDLYIIPQTPGVLLAKKGEDEALGVQRRPILGGGTTGGGATLPGIQKFTLDSDIKATDIEVLVSINETNLKGLLTSALIYGKGLTEGEASSDLNDWGGAGKDTVIKLARKLDIITVDFEEDPGLDEGTVITPKCEVDKNGKVTLTITSNVDINQPSKPDPNKKLGTLKISIEGCPSIAIPMAVAAK